MNKAQSEILNFFERYNVQVGDRSVLWVAVSGGRDSMLLMHATADLWHREKLQQFSNLRIVHVNHGVRGENAKRDADFVEEQAQMLGLGCEVIDLPFSQTDSKSEAELREHRYREIEFLLGDADFVMTAHHAQDQTETILLNMIRGTGLRGLRGISPVRGPWLRPLLRLENSILQEAAVEMDLDWYEDETNTDQKFDRNWLRHSVLPMIEARRPGAIMRISRIAEDAQNEWLEQKQQTIGATAETIHKAQAKDPRSGVQISSIAKLTGLPYALWGDFLGLTLYRSHVDTLSGIIQKGFGRLDVPSGKIWISCSWVLWWKHDDDLRQFRRVQNMGSAFESVLGVWELHSGIGVFSLREDTETSTSIKKRLQDAGIPAFLRSCIPLFEFYDKDRERRLRALIPVDWSTREEWNLGKGERITFTPAKFATEIFAKKKQLIGGSPDQLPSRGRNAT